MVVGMEGQITLFPMNGKSPCYRCLHPFPSRAEACRSCANAGRGSSLESPALSLYIHIEVGVLGPVPGMIGTLQAIEVIKLLTHRDLASNSPAARGEDGEAPLLATS
jgi:molybdopterin/thiamine biosynthesis adenylyltransferase